MQRQVKIIGHNLLPILAMIGLIPLIRNDYYLGVAYCLVIAASFLVHYEKHELKIIVIGALLMFIFELFFISTGVETFNRTSLFNLMPIWLPLLWGYGFVAIKRVAKVLGL